MANRTYIKFHILPFCSKADEKLITVGIFSTLYLTGIFLNSVVITAISLDAHLHTPMYLFFCNLSIVDICYTTVVIPKLLYIISSGNDLVSFTQCFTQVYFFIISASAEVILFFVMGFDRFVAICKPLHYHQILCKKNCTRIIVLIWAFALLNSLLALSLLVTLPFDEVVSIHNFFCDAIDVFHASHGGNSDFYIMVYVEILLLVVFPFSYNVFSYSRIINVILQIKSTKGRRKTFSTCSSHFIIMIIYYSAAAMVYTMPLSGHTEIMKQILSVFYVIVVPMVNPLIYSLRNSEIMRACHRLLKIK